ncbi:MAG: RsfS/YbeB/iojap family protein, partial [Planctomycetota bacterium]|nr:RsfS/YbeB/iojap family protein [Planctomycetota bacterium]
MASDKNQRSLQAVERANRQAAKHIADLCRRGRAENILILDLRRLCDFTDYFVIATGTSAVQLRGVAEEIRKT